MNKLLMNAILAVVSISAEIMKIGVSKRYPIAQGCSKLVSVGLKQLTLWCSSVFTAWKIGRCPPPLWILRTIWAMPLL